MIERKGVVTFKGDEITLLGNEVKVGDKAPDFTVLDNDMAPVSLKDSAGSVRIISVVPSLDTVVCDQQARRFNEEATKLPDVKVLNISVDLPFAQKRWCGAAGIEHAQTLSDHRDLSFGLNYGVAIKEHRLLTRAVFVIDQNDRVIYAQYVPEAIDHPDYEAPVLAAKKALEA